jgi:hypothetical protein
MCCACTLHLALIIQPVYSIINHAAFIPYAVLAQHPVVNSFLLVPMTSTKDGGFWDVISWQKENSYCCFKALKCLHLWGVLLATRLFLQNVHNYLPVDLV